MIHKLLVFNNLNHNCSLLYDNGLVDLRHNLLIRLIKATIQLGQEMDKSLSISLQEIEIGKLQIGLLGKDNFTYIVVQDSLDNEAFTRRILDSIINEFHSKVANLAFLNEFDRIDNYQKGLSNFLNTMKFPQERLPSVDYIAEQFIQKISKCDTLFITDLDDGIVKVWKNTKDGSIVKILSEILSEMDIDKSWIGEIPQFPVSPGSLDHEIWFIYRLEYSDFCLLGRSFYSDPNEREEFIYQVERLTQEIVSIIQH